MSLSLLSVHYRYAYSHHSILWSAFFTLSRKYTSPDTQSTRRSLWSGDKTSSKPAASYLNQRCIRLRIQHFHTKTCWCFLVGDSRASEFYVPALQNMLFDPLSWNSVKKRLRINSQVRHNELTLYSRSAARFI